MIVGNRREFIRGAAAAAAGYLARRAPAAPTKMKLCLNAGYLGVRASLAETVDLAAKHGFEAFDPNAKELAALSDAAMSAMLDSLAAKNLTFGSCSQGFTFGQADDAWAAAMKDLALTAKALERARVRRLVSPSVSPSDNNLTYLQNFRLHARRIGEIATVLGGSGISLGLEYIGSKTSWTRSKYPFVHTMATMRELIAEANKPNIGMLLDIWHWYTAGDTVADVLSLKPQDIIAVHLSDAVTGVPIDQQSDRTRELPVATGVIDTAGFMNALNQVGYDGPAASEPMNADLRKLPPDEALAKTAEAMKKAFALIK